MANSSLFWTSSLASCGSGGESGSRLRWRGVRGFCQRASHLPSSHSSRCLRMSLEERLLFCLPPRSCPRTRLAPRAADVISHFRKKKRQHISASTDKLVCSKTGFSTCSSHVTSTSTRLSEVLVWILLSPRHSGRQSYRRLFPALLSVEHAETLFGVAHFMLEALLCFLRRMM